MIIYIYIYIYTKTCIYIYIYTKTYIYICWSSCKVPIFLVGFLMKLEFSRQIV